jgi:PhnB protein
MPVKPIPVGYTSITPYLVMKGAAQAIEFYKKAFGAVEVGRMAGPDGKIGHADIMIGNAHVMLADEQPQVGAVAPAPNAHSTSIHLYVEDVDAVFARALALGAKACRPVSDQFYGDRSGVLTDPFGHVWGIATHKEDLTLEEIGRRAQAAGKY